MEKENIPLLINELVEKLVNKEYIAGDSIINNQDCFEWNFKYDNQNITIYYQNK